MNKMTHDYIRQIIPEDISEKGGVRLRLVNAKTIPLETSIKEAKATGCVLGDEELVKRQFEGLVQCMRDGVEADGMARQIGGWVTVYPVFTGPIDLAKGFDPEKNGVRIRMRLLNEIDVDITDWEFRDVTPGRTPFTLDAASTGALVNEVEIDAPIHINGRPFPPTSTLRIDWAIEGTDKSGTVPAEKFTSDATLINIAADALAELASEEFDGKTIVFTVRGHFASAKISATLKYGEDPTVPRLTGFDIDGEAVEKLTPSCDFDILGENLEAFDMEHGGGSKVTLAFTAGARAGTTVEPEYTEVSTSPRHDGRGVFVSSINVDLAAGEKGTVTVTIDGKTSNALPFEVAAE